MENKIQEALNEIKRGIAEIIDIEAIEKVVRRFYETGENGLGRTRMLKHEFDTLLVMYAIDVLEELQQQISKNDHLIPKK